MSAAQPIRSFAAKRLALGFQSAIPRCRAPFHSSPANLARKSRFKSIRAEAMGLVTPQQVEQFTEENFPKYTKEELKILAEHYTPQQMAALKAGEAAIDPKDLTIQGRLRVDSHRLQYLDDFTKIHPVIDHRPKTAEVPTRPTFFMDEKEHADDLERHLAELIPKNVNFEDMTPQEIEAFLDKNVDIPLAQSRYFQERSAVKRKYQEKTDSAMVPGLGKNIPGVSGAYSDPVDPEDEGLDDQGIYRTSKARTGLTVKELLEMNTRVLVKRFVTNQSRLGKIQRWSILVIAGNGHGRLGVGEAKGVEPHLTETKARLLSLRSMKPIRRYEDRTIYGKVEGKFGATVVQLSARPPGFGIRASHRFFEIFRAIGIHDIAAKMPRSRTPLNSVKACIQALMNQKDPEAIAIGRGKKLVDLRKVYYGGNTR